MDLVGIREFARRKGVSHTLVSRALRTGRIVDAPKGSKNIDWETQSIAFDNNCDLKHKLATRTKSELAKQLAAMRTEADTPIVSAIQPRAPRPAPPPPPPPAPKPAQKPKPAPAPKPAAPKPAPQRQAWVNMKPAEPAIHLHPLPPPPPPIATRVVEQTAEEIAEQEAQRQAAKDRDTYNKARTAEQVYKAQILELELKAKRGEYRPAAEVRKGIQKIAEVLKKGLEAIPDSVSDQLAGMTDENEIHALLRNRMSEVLKEIGDACRALAS